MKIYERLKEIQLMTRREKRKGKLDNNVQIYKTHGVLVMHMGEGTRCT